MVALGVALTVWNRYAAHKDLELATGQRSPAQERFLVQAADRPDIETFFRGLTPAQRLTMAKNIGLYTDPNLAELCARLLGDFDADARAGLTGSLSKIAKLHPEAVAGQLSKAGSFQILGVSRALDVAGRSALPAVAKELSDDGARANAGAYLVQAGRGSIPYLLPLLTSNEEPTRMAAEEALGKLRARSAVPALTKAYRKGGQEEKETALVALAAIADPATERLLSDNLSNPSMPIALRCEAALGLGRIRTTSTATTLWRFTSSSDWPLREAATSALILCDWKALVYRPESPSAALLLRVAAGIPGTIADAVIREALLDPDLCTLAAGAAANRPGLVPDIAVSLADPTLAANGRFAEAAIASLRTTSHGQALLESGRFSFRRNPLLAGFMRRPGSQ